MAEIVLKIEGMSCSHCKAAVEKALQGTNGVEKVEVDLENGKAVVVGSAKRESLKKAVEEEGYTVVD